MTITTKYEFNQAVWFIKDGKIKKDWINYIFVQKGVDDVPFHRYQFIYNSGLHREVDVFATEEECIKNSIDYLLTN